VSPASNVIGLSSACLRAQAALRVFVLVALLALSVDAFGGASKAAPKTAAKKVAKKAPVKKVAAKKPAKAVVKRGGFSPETDIGVTPPLGLFDPLGFLNRGPEVYRRYQEIEIKHGRFAMAATLGVITTEAGVRFPGYISLDQDLKFSDVPGSLDGAYFGIPIAGWVQIVALIAALDIAVFRQDPAYDAGDVVQDLPIDWVRYGMSAAGSNLDAAAAMRACRRCTGLWDMSGVLHALWFADDPEVKAFKLNAERNNGRAAMFGILGMISHTALGQDALFPIISK